MLESVIGEKVQARSPAASTRFDALDGVRGIAVLAVLMHRFDVLDDATLAARLLGFTLDHGWVGVQLFFVLSGFLITSALLDSRNATNYYSAFFARRALRILPLYYLTLIAAFVFVPLIVDLSPEARAQLGHQVWAWLFLLNWTIPLGIDVHGLSHFWSLAVEEQFYLVWPFVVRRLTLRQLVAFTVGVLVVAPIVRAGLLAIADRSFAEGAAYMFTVCRADALAFGAVVAIGMRTPGFKAFVSGRSSTLMSALAALVFISALLTHGFAREGLVAQVLGYSVLGIAFAAMIAAAVLTDGRATHPLQRLLCWAPLRSCGKYSYAMYIFHAPLHLFVLWPATRALTGADRLGWAASLAYIAGASVVTYVAGFASYRLIEQRCLAWKRYFEPRSVELRGA